MADDCVLIGQSLQIAAMKVSYDIISRLRPESPKPMTGTLAAFPLECGF
jgi:hypothetical protein